MGEAINLINNFKVEKVIFTNGEYNDLENELYNNENNNSNVIHIKLNEKYR